MYDSFSYISKARLGPTKIAKPAIFQAVLRGIGKSFQSAITAPRVNLTGYGNATAQSQPTKVPDIKVIEGEISTVVGLLSKTFFLKCRNEDAHFYKV